MIRVILIDQILTVSHQHILLLVKSFRDVAKIRARVTEVAAFSTIDWIGLKYTHQISVRKYSKSRVFITVVLRSGTI